MSQQSRSAVLFGELVEALVDEGVQTGEFEIDSMRYAQMELLGHGLGRELSQRVQEALAARQGARMPDVFPCPTCGRECAAEVRGRPVVSVDGEVEIDEVRCHCRTCRRSFFPSA